MSSLSALCKNINGLSKSIKGIKTKLGILAHHDIMQLQSKGHNSERYIFLELCPFLTKNFK